MTYYERNLPHWHPARRAIFLTWRLHGSLPEKFLHAPPASPKNSAGMQFRAIDKELDSAKFGPLWLNDPRVAKCVIARLTRGHNDLGEYVLHAFTLMANHVHTVIEPIANLGLITKGIKGATAREANLILGRTGEPFWQGESFDHWVRNAVQFERIRNYIERNAVTAGLVTKAEDWPWSSANPRYKLSDLAHSGNRTA
jgi:putative transposase